MRHVLLVLVLVLAGCGSHAIEKSVVSGLNVENQTIAYSTDLGHLFHAKPATHSRGSRPVCRSEATLLNCF